MKVAVIGAGFAGLAVCKYCKQFNISVDCFEQSDSIGGIWAYNENTGLDKNGLPIHTPMYKNLLINKPQENMAYHDFPVVNLEKSYVSSKEIIEYLESYIDFFGFKKSIKFEHLVVNVEPLEDDKWRVTHKNLIKNEQKSDTYDAVFVCNGKYFDPNTPKIQGIENFKGKIIHSHVYRVPEAFKGQRVLTIGAGPSGIDITMDLSSVADFVGFSHHGSIYLKTGKENVFNKNVKQLPDVAEILEDGKVRFLNGEEIDFDSIVFCTGYNNSYNFLSPECQIRVEDNHVRELYKHIININHPTMYFIGLTFATLIVPLMDLQVRFSLKFLTNAIKLPSTEQMRKATNEDTDLRQLRGYTKRKMHQLGAEYMKPYMDDLTTMAKLEPIKPVILDIYYRRQHLMQHDLRNYKKFNYQIIDDVNFVEMRQE